MNSIYDYPFILILCFFIGLLILLFKRGRTKVKYLIEIVVRGSEISKHDLIFKELKDLEFEYLFNNCYYKVKKVDLYKFKRWGLRKRIKLLFKRCKGIYIITFNEGNSQAIRVDTSMVSPDILKIVNDSRALSKSIKAEFSKALEGKKMLFIIVIIVVIVFVVLYLTGTLQSFGLII